MYENDVPAELGSYNSLQKQVAFCKMQVRQTKQTRMVVVVMAP